MRLWKSITLATVVLGLAAIYSTTYSTAAAANETVIRPAVLTRSISTPANAQAVAPQSSASVPVTNVGWRYRAAYGYPYYAGRPYVAYRPYVAPYAYPAYPYYGPTVVAPYRAYYRGPAVYGGYYGRYPGRYHW